MVALIAVLVVGVVYLAYKSPSPTDAANEQNPGPNVNVPSLGNVGNPSPAMSGGAPAASQLYRTAMSVNAGIVGKLGMGGTSFKNSALQSVKGTFMPPDQTVSEMSKTLMTQKNQQLTRPANGPLNGSRVIKI